MRARKLRVFKIDWVFGKNALDLSTLTRRLRRHPLPQAVEGRLGRKQ
jgi:hypothetical protein